MRTAGSIPPIASTTTSASVARKASRSAVSGRSDRSAARESSAARTSTVTMSNATPCARSISSRRARSARTSSPPTTPHPANARRTLRTSAIASSVSARFRRTKKPGPLIARGPGSGKPVFRLTQSSARTRRRPASPAGEPVRMVMRMTMGVATACNGIFKRKPGERRAAGHRSLAVVLRGCKRRQITTRTVAPMVIVEAPHVKSLVCARGVAGPPRGSVIDRDRSAS